MERVLNGKPSRETPTIVVILPIIYYNIIEYYKSTYNKYLKRGLKMAIQKIKIRNLEMKPQSKSKFYVGVTRARHSVAIIFDNKKGITIPGIINFTL